MAGAVQPVPVRVVISFAASYDDTMTNVCPTPVRRNAGSNAGIALSRVSANPDPINPASEWGQGNRRIDDLSLRNIEDRYSARRQLCIGGSAPATPFETMPTGLLNRAFELAARGQRRSYRDCQGDPSL